MFSFIKDTNSYTEQQIEMLSLHYNTMSVKRVDHLSGFTSSKECFILCKPNNYMLDSGWVIKITDNNFPL